MSVRKSEASRSGARKAARAAPTKGHRLSPELTRSPTAAAAAAREPALDALLAVAADYYWEQGADYRFTVWRPTSDRSHSLDSQAFWKAFHDCAAKLPRNVSTVFTLRELDGLEGREICRLLDITENNLWVMLHRARMALRRCLEVNWFGKQS